jgi:hypothetical protein
MTIYQNPHFPITFVLVCSRDAKDTLLSRSGTLQIMADRMRDDKKEASTKLSPTSANKHPSNAQKRSCDKEIPKKKKFQRTDTSKSICDNKNRSLVNDIHFHGKKYIRAEGEDVICDYAHDSWCNGTCLPWDNNFLILQMYPEEKTCFPSFYELYGNCNLEHTRFENIFFMHPNKACELQSTRGLKMSMKLVDQPTKQLLNVRRSHLEECSLTLLVKQWYDQTSLSCNEAAFVSNVPYLCECYRTPLFHLTQEEFYEVVVKVFEANT